MNAPMLTQETKRTLAWLAVAVLFLALLKLLAPTLTPFVFAFILSYILHPGVHWLQRHRVPRVFSVFLMIVVLSIVGVALTLLVLAVLQKEIPAIREQLPGMLAKVNAVLSPRLAELGVHVRFDFPGLRRLLSDQLAASPDDVMATTLNYLRVSGSAAAQVLGMVFLVPIVMFYLLMDWNMLMRRLETAVPRRWLAKTRELAAETDALLSQYLRGQIIVMLVLAVYYSAGLALAGFDVALPVGIFTGLAVFIPYIGFGVGLTLAVLSALLQFGNLYGLLAVAVVYGIGQFLESFYLTPRLVGERIGLHPLAVILALLAFGQLFGFFGILLALPISAVLLVGLRQIRQLYLNSKLYRD
ncbi:Putative transport protein [Ralstonia condita]|uniref:Transport protein n=1 Tax=Ralstonia condita TaxID=3058600 RepID=A0ABN9I8P9_9RALS|nr:AI-2E family transporter [Ralstonia sp. LMG 7141]CAJ0774655.1 Putative transport protein [Ralstonia sp. LMG 7141]